MRTLKISAFKTTGKFYTEYFVKIPENIENWKIIKYLIKNKLIYYPNMYCLIQSTVDINKNFDNYIMERLYIPYIPEPEKEDK